MRAEPLENSPDTVRMRVCVTVKRDSMSITSRAKISLTSPIVINVPTRASLAVKTKGLVSVVAAFE